MVLSGLKSGGKGSLMRTIGLRNESGEPIEIHDGRFQVGSEENGKKRRKVASSCHSPSLFNFRELFISFPT